MIKLIDSHAHLGSSEMFQDIDEILARATEAGVESIVNICTNAETLQRGLELASRYSWIHNTASTTPHDVEKEGESFFPLVVQTAKEGKLAAIGETGLDYFYEHSDRDLQKKYFIRYLHLALENQLPIVIHCRDAFSDFFSIIDAEYRNGGNWAPGILHCFTGNVADAEEVVKRGWYVSLSGIVTFKKSELLRQAASVVPLNQLLIETDAPYLAPQSHRGKRNESSYLLETAAVMASVKGISVESLAEATRLNARRAFAL